MTRRRVSRAPWSATGECCSSTGLPSKRHYPDVWDLFGGHVEGGESPEEALRREAREELGIEVLATRWLGQIHDPIEPAAVQVYAVASWKGEPVNAAPEEHTEVRWFGAGELPASEALDAYGTLLVRTLRGKGEGRVPANKWGRRGKAASVEGPERMPNP